MVSLVAPIPTRMYCRIKHVPTVLGHQVLAELGPRALGGEKVRRTPSRPFSARRGTARLLNVCLQHRHLCLVCVQGKVYTVYRELAGLTFLEPNRYQDTHNILIRRDMVPKSSILVLYAVLVCHISLGAGAKHVEVNCSRVAFCHRQKGTSKQSCLARELAQATAASTCNDIPSTGGPHALVNTTYPRGHTETRPQGAA